MRQGDRVARPRLALHVCCGPCATVSLERLGQRFEIVGFWYNPNLHPADEYQRRLEAARLVFRHFGVGLVEGAADLARWREAVQGLEQEPEGGRRCEVCFRLRLQETVAWARQAGCQYVTTTLTVGPHKPVEKIHAVGEALAAAAGLRWLPETLRKAGGFQRAMELSRQLGLYRQNYCGCVFSQAGKRPAPTRMAEG
jgi:predicted adenine nucleotide alpha hydrolase (AANH) superfamily ATPase